MSTRRPKDRSHWGDAAFAAARAARNPPSAPLPSARELLTLLGMEDTVETLAARVEAVLALHKHCKGVMREWCSECVEVEGKGCHVEWPCPTVRILDGGKP